MESCRHRNTASVTANRGRVQRKRCVHGASIERQAEERNAACVDVVIRCCLDGVPSFEDAATSGGPVNALSSEGAPILSARAPALRGLQFDYTGGRYPLHFPPGVADIGCETVAR